MKTQEEIKDEQATFNELATLMAEKKNIEEYIHRTRSIAFTGEYLGQKKYIGIIDHQNNRFNFNGVEKIISEEKMSSILEQLIMLFAVELHKERELKIVELSKYQITKS